MRVSTLRAQANRNACRGGSSRRSSSPPWALSRLLGRDFLAEEDRPGATPAVILSYGFWQRRFGADPGILGKQLTLNNQSFTVVGITPASFQFGLEADVTVPIGLSAERFSESRQRSGNWRRRAFETERVAAAGERRI